MSERSISASRFKAECLALLDAVASTGSTLVVTKRGRAVARVVPVDPPEPLDGSVSFLVGDDELLAPVAADWHAETP